MVENGIALRMKRDKTKYSRCCIDVGSDDIVSYKVLKS
jgi:hypothetical protein